MRRRRPRHGDGPRTTQLSAYSPSPCWRRRSRPRRARHAVQERRFQDPFPAQNGTPRHAGAQLGTGGAGVGCRRHFGVSIGQWHEHPVRSGVVGVGDRRAQPAAHEPRKPRDRTRCGGAPVWSPEWSVRVGRHLILSHARCRAWNAPTEPGKRRRAHPLPLSGSPCPCPPHSPVGASLSIASISSTAASGRSSAAAMVARSTQRPVPRVARPAQVQVVLGPSLALPPRVSRECSETRSVNRDLEAKARAPGRAEGLRHQPGSTRTRVRDRRLPPAMADREEPPHVQKRSAGPAGRD